MKANGENYAKKACRTPGAKELLVSQHQHGFRDGMSCLTGLIDFYDQETRIRQEREGWADCIFLDCQKAFDTVPHQRLVRKLEMQTGVKGKVLHWIMEYLSNRRQRVTVRGLVSDWRDQWGSRRVHSLDPYCF